MQKQDAAHQPPAGRSASGQPASGAMRALDRGVSLHRQVAGVLSRAGDAWAIGLAARFSFAAVLLVYYWHSASLKISEGLFGFLFPTAGAYAQILPQITEAAGYNPANIGFIYHLVVLAGTWAEFVLPFLIVAGLFTRLAALGMIGFICVQSWVDITGHNADAETIGAWFDRLPDAAILDQRLFWVFVLLMLVLKGPGLISLDAALNRFWHKGSPAP